MLQAIETHDVSMSLHVYMVLVAFLTKHHNYGAGSCVTIPTITCCYFLCDYQTSHVADLLVSSSNLPIISLICLCGYIMHIYHVYIM